MSTKNIFIIFLIIGLGVLGLFWLVNRQSPEPDESQTQTTTNTTPAETKTVLDESVSNSTLTLDTTKSVINWQAQKVFTNQHYGTVKLTSGNINLENDEKITGEFIADMRSIVSLDASGKTKKMLENHLHSSDFFDTTQFPEAKFVITNSEKISEAEYILTGNLIIKNISNEIQVPILINQEEGQYKATADFIIDRTLWDIHFGSGKFFAELGDKAIKDEINLQVELYAN